TSPKEHLISLTNSVARTFLSVLPTTCFPPARFVHLGCTVHPSEMRSHRRSHPLFLEVNNEVTRPESLGHRTLGGGRQRAQCGREKGESGGGLAADLR